MKIIKNPNIKLASKNGNFELIERNGVGIENTPFHCLEVISKNLADKYVVDIRLNSTWHDFNGEPVEYRYYGDPQVAYGMRSVKNTYDDIHNFIEVLNEAVDFAKDVKKYIEENGWESK